MVDHGVPGLMLVLIALSANLLGDWLRDASTRACAEAERWSASHDAAPGRRPGRRIPAPPRHAARAWTAFHFDIAPGEILGVVGESGAGKSLTGAAIIGLLEPPGRVAGGEILLEGQRIDNLGLDAMRPIRGRKIGAIFQDPLTSLNLLYTVGRQLIETIRARTCR